MIGSTTYGAAGFGGAPLVVNDDPPSAAAWIFVSIPPVLVNGMLIAEAQPTTCQCMVEQTRTTARNDIYG